MSKKKEGIIEFTDEFSAIGTITKVETFTSKGGGLSIKLQLPNDHSLEIGKIIDSIEKAMKITFQVSAKKLNAAGDEEEQGELDLEDMDGVE